MNEDIYLEKWEQLYPELRAGRILYDAHNNNPYRLRHEIECIRCWSDETLVRSQLPKHWWLTSDYHIISVSTKRPRMVPIQKNKRKEQRYSFFYKTVAGMQKQINLSISSLMALVFGYRAFGQAERLLNTIGLEAIGRGNGKVICHHIRKYQRQASLEYNADPMHLVFLTWEWHTLLHSFEDFRNKPPKQQDTLCHKLFNLMERDNVSWVQVQTALYGKDDSIQPHLDYIGQCMHITKHSESPKTLFVWSPEALANPITQLFFEMTD